MERMCEDQSLSTEGDVWNLPATDEGRAGARHDPVVAASKETLVTRQELMLIGEKPGVEAIEVHALQCTCVKSTYIVEDWRQRRCGPQMVQVGMYIYLLQ